MTEEPSKEAPAQLAPSLGCELHRDYTLLLVPILSGTSLRLSEAPPKPPTLPTVMVQTPQQSDPGH